MPQGLIIQQSGLTLTLGDVEAVFTDSKLPRRRKSESQAEMDHAQSGNPIISQAVYSLERFDFTFYATDDQKDVLLDMFALADLDRSQVVFTTITDFTEVYRELDTGVASRAVAPGTLETIENGLRKYYARFKCRWDGEPEVNLNGQYIIKCRLSEARL